MSAEALRLGVSVVTYKIDLDMFERFAQSLAVAIDMLTQSYEARISFVVVVNDEKPRHVGDVEAIVERILSALPDRVVLYGQGNIGYGAAQNLAFRWQSTDLHLFLNPDIVIEPAALANCFGYMADQPSVVLLAPQGFDPQGTFARLAKRDPSVLVLLLRALSVGPSGSKVGKLIAEYTYEGVLPSRNPEAIKHASGCFMCVRSSVFESAGGFDERFFLYFEDYDLSRRLAPFGDLVEVPNVRICHYGGSTSRRGAKRVLAFSVSAIRFFGRYGWRIF